VVEDCFALGRIERRKGLGIAGDFLNPGGVGHSIHQLKIMSNVAPRSDGVSSSSPP